MNKSIEKQIKDRLWYGEYWARSNKHYHRIMMAFLAGGEAIGAILTLVGAMLAGSKITEFLQEPTVEFAAWGVGFFSVILIVLKFSDRHRTHYFLFRRWNDMDINWKEAEALSQSGGRNGQILERMSAIEIESIRIEGEQPKQFYWLKRYCEKLVEQEEGILDKYPIIPIFKDVKQ